MLLKTFNVLLNEPQHSNQDRTYCLTNNTNSAHIWQMATALVSTASIEFSLSFLYPRQFTSRSTPRPFTSLPQNINPNPFPVERSLNLSDLSVSDPCCSFTYSLKASIIHRILTPESQPYIIDLSFD